MSTGCVPGFRRCAPDSVVQGVRCTRVYSKGSPARYCRTRAETRSASIGSEGVGRLRIGVRRVAGTPGLGPAAAHQPSWVESARRSSHTDMHGAPTPPASNPHLICPRHTRPPDLLSVQVGPVDLTHFCLPTCHNRGTHRTLPRSRRSACACVRVATRQGMNARKRTAHRPRSVRFSASFPGPPGAGVRCVVGTLGLRLTAARERSWAVIIIAGCSYVDLNAEPSPGLRSALRLSSPH